MLQKILRIFADPIFSRDRIGQGSQISGTDRIGYGSQFSGTDRISKMEDQHTSRLATFFEGRLMYLTHFATRNGIVGTALM